MKSLFTKDYRIKEMNYKSVGTVGRFEWLITRVNNGFQICAINKLDEVEFGTEQFISDEIIEIIKIFTNSK